MVKNRNFEYQKKSISGEIVMKYFLLLSGILLTCFCTLMYLANIKALGEKLGDSTLNENLLGATTATLITEGAMAAKPVTPDTDTDRRIDRLEERINQELSKLDNRIKILEAKR
jgi:hypothetical protein